MLTNDGELAQLLTHPRTASRRSISPRSRVSRRRRRCAASRRRRTSTTGRSPGARAEVVQESADGDSALEIVLKEGRKRIVRRMCAEIGHPVVGWCAPGSGRSAIRSSRPVPAGADTPEVRALYAAGSSGSGQLSDRTR